MNIVVCIKQIPDTAEVRIDPETNTLIRQNVRAVTNIFDLHAIEEALRLRETYGGKVTVISMGPMQAERALKEAIGMGADEAILLNSRKFAGSDTWATSYALSMAIRRIGAFDLIICGKQALDGDTAQVGPGIAAHLNIPQITYVSKIDKIEEGSITANRMTETGYDVVQSSLPCLLTVVKEINIPRYQSIEGKIRAKTTKVVVWNESDIGCDTSKLGLSGSPTRVRKAFSAGKKGGEAFVDTEENIRKVTGEVVKFIWNR